MSVFKFVWKIFQARALCLCSMSPKELYAAWRLVDIKTLQINTCYHRQVVCFYFESCA